MRSLEQYEQAKREHYSLIKRLEEEDAKFSGEPIHTKAIEGAQGAISYIESQIEKHYS